MLNEYYLKVAILFTPIISSLTTLLITWYSYRTSRDQRRKIHTYILLYFANAFVSWIGMSCYFGFPKVFAIFNSVILLTFILIQIFFYAFVFEITKTKQKESFGIRHYIAPFILFATLSILMLSTPFDKQIELIEKLGEYNNQPIWFYRLSNNKMIVRLVFTLIYTGLGFYRLHKYRTFVVNYSTNEEKSQLRWVSVLLFLSLILIIIPITGSIINKSNYLSNVIYVLPSLLLVVQYSYLCYHVINKNHILIEDDSKEIDFEVENEVLDTETQLISGAVSLSNPRIQGLTKEYFEDFIIKNKSYLNPNLKITDLVKQMGINRTYISSFINNEYSVNFNKYINQKRLEEFEKLVSNPKYEARTKKELAILAGFSSYKSYLRWKNSENDSV